MNQIDIDVLHKLVAYILYRDKYEHPPDFHFDILHKFTNEDTLQTIVAPVGFAKSLCIKTFALKAMLEGTKYQLYVSSSYTKATQQLTTLSKILKNKNIQNIFEFELSTLKEDYLEIKQKEEIRGIKAVASGADILGTTLEGQRPHNIIIDDLEEQDQARSVMRTRKLADWLSVSLLSRLPSLTEGRVRMIGTNLGVNSIINQMLNGYYPDWSVYLYSAFNENGNSIWESRFPTHALHKKQASEPHTFAANYLNEPFDISNSLVSEEDLDYYDYIDLQNFDKLYLHADTTHTAKSSSDYYACVVMAQNKQDGKYYVIDMELRKDLQPYQQRQNIINKFKKYTITKGTYDAVSNDSFEHDLLNEARQQDVYPIFEGVKYSSDKYAHAVRHEALWKTQSIVLPERHNMLAEAVKQITSFSEENVKANSGVHDDVMDAISSCLDMLTDDSVDMDAMFDTLDKIYSV